MDLRIKNLGMKKSKKPQLLLLLFLIILFSLFFFFYFKKVESKINAFFLTGLKSETKVIGSKIDDYLIDSNSFLFFTKRYLENRLEESDSLSKNIKDRFNKKYGQSKRNLVSNYQFILAHREDRKSVSASYLNKNEILTNEIKFVAVITEELDTIWKTFFKKYPFITMTYVDKTGFYREFPFRKLEPNTISYLSDPRNYPYYSIATTIARDEIFLTLPYQNGNNLYVSMVAPVYQNDNFRGLLTIDISLNNFEKLIFRGSYSQKISNQDIIVFDRKGNIYLYLLNKSQENLINKKNLDETLKNQEKLLTKNIKIYPLITNKTIINFIDNFLKGSNTDNIAIKVVGNSAVSLSNLKSYKLNVLIVTPLNLITNLNFIEDIENGILILIIFLFFLFISLLYIVGRRNPEEEVTLDLINRIKDSKLRENILSDLKENSGRNILELLETKISAYISDLQQQIAYLKASLDNINMGVVVINQDDKSLFSNKWFKQLIIDVDSLDLMPEELRNEILKFMGNNIQQFQKMIRLFERHYILSGEKVVLTIGNKKENLLIFTLINAENINKIKKESEELKNRIEVLEKNINSYRKSFENLNSRIIQSDKFAVFGEFIQGIVHNINNPLMIVTSRLSMVKTIIEGLDDSMEKRRLLKHITNIIVSLKKINSIIDSVLIKAKMTVEKEERLVNLNEIIRSELEFFNADLFFKHKVKKEIELDPNLPKVRISQSDFSQILHNLIKNALDALKSSSDPVLEIKTYRKEKLVVIEIIDNGPGVPEKYRDKIFEQYFTTKGSSGTGIGLYNARKILEEYNGELILADSKKGAKFIIKIPIAEGE